MGVTRRRGATTHSQHRMGADICAQSARQAPSMEKDESSPKSEIRMKSIHQRAARKFRQTHKKNKEESENRGGTAFSGK